MTTIEISGIELHGHHGVLEEERRDGQRFLVDVEAQPVHDAAGATDDIVDAVDYRDIVAIVCEVSDGTAFHLLEAFAAALADELLRRLRLRKVVVRVRKPDVRLARPVEHAAVVVERAISGP